MDIGEHWMIVNNDVDKYIDNMLNSFLNKQHRKEAEEYLFVRERIDKVNNYREFLQKHEKFPKN